MRHARVERWARGSSFLHRLHPAAKIAATLVMLVCISSLQRDALVVLAIYLLLLLAMVYAARLPVLAVFTTAAAILPFACSFALISLVAGQRERALLLILRSYLSSCAALLLVATTPMPALISSLELLRVPRFLLLVMQFLYRYLVVLFAEATAIRDASTSRGGGIRTLQWEQAGAAAGVLFARSYHRANAIHQAMEARGFEGSIPTLFQPLFTVRDATFVIAVSAFSIFVRVFVS